MEKKVWVLIDDRAGSNSQARGVAKILGWPAEEKQLIYDGWAKLPNFLKGATLVGIKAESRQNLQQPYPDLVISASRRTAPVARWIKRKSAGKTKIVQLMHPGNVGLAEFDRVFIPEHDQGKKMGKNVQKVIGCAHKITPDFLAEAKEKWQAVFASLPQPRTAVIVGGAIKSSPFSMENALDLAERIKSYKQKYGGSILITTSRRTGLAAQEKIMRELKDFPAYTYLWGVDKGDNPYGGYLACADDIIVTGDSVSMCCEACGTGKKVLVFQGKNWLTPKHKRFIASLFNKGYAFPLEDEYDYDGDFDRYNPADIIAAEIKKIF